MLRHRSLQLFTFVVCSAALAGCSLFNRKSPSGEMFRLNPIVAAEFPGPKLGSILIDRTNAAPPFDGAAFIYRLGDGSWRIDPYNGFIANPGDMLTANLLQAFDGSGRFTLVATSRAGVRCDFALESVLTDFYADFTDPLAPVAITNIRGYLVDRRGFKQVVLAAFDGAGRAPIESDTPRVVADAFSQSSANAITALLQQIPQTIPPIAIGNAPLSTTTFAPPVTEAPPATPSK